MTDSQELLAQYVADGSEGEALVWQGHILDLLERREEAVSAYAKAAAFNPRFQHEQYGIVVTAQYVQERIQTPFVRVERAQPAMGNQ